MPELSEKWFRLVSPREGMDWQKDQVLEAVHWFKQVLSMLLGILFGLIPIQGFSGIVIFAIVILMATNWFTDAHLKVADSVVDRYEILGEGLMSAVALFLLFWISVYSSAQF